MNKVLFFDSDCLVCNRFIQFVSNHDKKRELYFSDFDSQIAKEQKLNMSQGMIYWSNNTYYYGAQAFREVMRQIQYSDVLDFILKVIPTEVQTIFYGIIMRNRHIFTSKSKSCALPDERFLK